MLSFVICHFFFFQKLINLALRLFRSRKTLVELCCGKNICGVFIMTFKSSPNFYFLSNMAHQKLRTVPLVFLEIYSSLFICLLCTRLNLLFYVQCALNWAITIIFKPVYLFLGEPGHVKKEKEKSKFPRKRGELLVAFDVCNVLNDISFGYFWKS